MTLQEMYQTTLEELAALEAARARLLGRADVLAELCAAGLRELDVPLPEPTGEPQWAPEPLAPPASRPAPRP